MGADIREAVKLARKLCGQPYAAMRRRMIRYAVGFVEGDAGPCQALHVGHWRLAVDIRLVMTALFQNAEHAGRRAVSGFARRNVRRPDQGIAGEDADRLVVQGYDHQDRFVGSVIGMGPLDRVLFGRGLCIGPGLGNAR